MGRTKKTKIIKPGLYQGIPNSEYHRGEDYKPFLSRSDLMHLQDSPAHFTVYKNSPDEETADMIFGSAAHEIIISKTEKEVAVGPETSRRTNVWKDFVTANLGKYCITAEEYLRIKAMEKIFRKHKLATALLYGATIEETCIWNHSMYEGVQGKCRPDIKKIIEPRHILADYKTTGKRANKSEFAKATVNYGYDVQAKWYTDGMFTITGKEWEFLFIVQEKQPPFAIQVFRATPKLLQLGEFKINYALKVYWDAKEQKEWDRSYMEKIHDLDPPAWAFNEWSHLITTEKGGLKYVNE